jgi:hypothetical protein
MEAKMNRKIFSAVIALVAMLSNLSQSQTIINYERTTFTGTYQTITGTSGPSGDDYAENYNLPFTFYYINHDYNEVRICTNGWIELGSAIRPLSSSNSLFNEDLFSIYEPNKTLAPWWDDISAYSYPVEYTTLGSSPSRVFVVQWRDVNSPLGSSRYVNFQVRLYETTNIIEFWYGGVSGSGNIEYASFGIEDEIGGTNHFIDGPTGSNTVGTTDLNSYEDWPTIFYRFSPAPVRVIKPNGGEFFAIGYTDTLKWSSTVSNIKLEYSTDSGNNWNIIENSVPAVTGKYEWLVPNTPSENSLVRISDATNPSVFDVSNGVFTISEPPVITVLPDSFYFVLNEGDSTESIMQILNSGLGNLFYEISIENVGDQSKGFDKSSFPNSSAMWKESFLKSHDHRDKNSKRIINDYAFPELVLPLIISDPAGDGGPVDIIQIRGRSTLDSVQLEFVFQTDLNPYDLGGYLGLDIDQDIYTGQPLPSGLPEQEVGCEFIVGFFSIEYNFVDLYDQYLNYLGSFTANYDSKSVRFSVPLSSLDNDDGVMNLAAVVGTGSGPTDWIPDQGYGVLGGNLWLTVEPLSGTILPGSSDDISVKIETENIDGGEFYANLLISSNDPVNQLVTIPVHLTVIGQPNLVAPDSVNFGQVYVGYPETLTAELRNNGSVTLEVSDIQSSNSLFSIQGNTSFNIEPLGTYQLQVLFSPASASVESGMLSIFSNDQSSPGVINLAGEGIFPPDITVSPDSFFYNLNVGDSIVTNLIIENTGLGELNFQISDRLVTGRTASKIPAQNYVNQKNALVGRNKLFGIETESLSILNSEIRVTTNLSTCLASDNLITTLPLIVQDIIGDGGVADIKEIRGRIFNNNLEIEYIFADGIIISDSTIAVLYLDTDRNPLTGATDPFYYHDLGVDYFIDYYPLGFGNEIVILEYSTGNQYSVPYIINGATISYSVPLSFLSNDDGEMDLLAVSGYENLGALDWAPDEGHATLFGDVFWLNENPTSGVIPPGGNMTIEIRANTSELIGGNYLASIDVQSNDPSNPVLEIPFALHLTGVPEIFVSPDSLNFGETYIGYYKSLFVTISNTGTDSLFGNITLNHPQFILSDSVFALPVGGGKNIEVQFHPTTVGIVSAELSVYSNATSTPIIVSLVGEGTIAPNIATNTNLMQFQAGAGGVIESELYLYNTGGSNLTVEISDLVTNASTERLFGAGYNMIYEINPDNGQIMNSFPTPIFTSDYSTGLAFSGEQLFFTNPESSPNIFVLNPQNGNIITYYSSQSNNCNGLAYIDPYLYVLDTYNNVIRVLNPTNGNPVNIIYPSVYIYGGLDGQADRLFASDSYMVYELDPQNGTLVNSFYTNNGAYGIGFTGERLFVSASWSGIDEYDPNTGNYISTISTTGYSGLAGGGTRDAEWLSESPSQVTIAGGDSSIIQITINAPTELGHYSADLILESNDPEEPETIVQVVLDVVTGIEESNSLPKEYSLYNNYPNPFNPSTTINYDLPKQSDVTLKIYNVVGEEVETLVNQEQMAGRYQVRWEASQLASGIYFYRLQADSFVDIKKMMLLK